MRNLKVAMAQVCALAGAIGLGIFGSASAQAAPASGALADAAGAFSIVDQAQYVYGGRRHCWYPNGWRGGGWYRCGYAKRRGYGWGGAAGWNGWAAPGVVVVAPRVVAPGRYYYGGRHYQNRRWRSNRWYYY